MASGHTEKNRNVIALVTEIILWLPVAIKVMTSTGQTLLSFCLSALVILLTCPYFKFVDGRDVFSRPLHLSIPAELQKQSLQIINSNTTGLHAINYTQFMFALKYKRYGEYILYYGRYCILGFMGTLVMGANRLSNLNYISN